MANQSGISPVSAVPKSSYTPKSFDQGKYQVQDYQYPYDLMGNSSSYGSNYVVFYINVNNESKMKENAANFIAESDLTAAEKANLAGKNISVGAAFGSAAGANVVTAGIGGFAAGKGALDTLVKTGSAMAVGALPAGMATGGLLTNVSAKNSDGTPQFSRSKKRLKTAIALYVPNQLSIRYGAGWGEEETFSFQAFLKGGEAISRAMKEGKMDAITDKDKGLTGLAGSFGLKALEKTNAGAAAALSNITGLAPNPMKEQIFKGVDFRTFTMEYQFAPRSSDEARNVLSIVNAFKYHMHPEYKDSNNFLFLYPSEFDIVYYHGGRENLNIHRHTSCVLTEFNVNYTPNGNFSTFADGIPTQINVQMTFKELTILTKELIAEGL